MCLKYVKALNASRITDVGVWPDVHMYHTVPPQKLRDAMSSFQEACVHGGRHAQIAAILTRVSVE